jgi:hypothetical protein
VDAVRSSRAVEVRGALVRRRRRALGSEIGRPNHCVRARTANVTPAVKYGLKVADVARCSAEVRRRDR